jgi:hypothetical protein
VRHRGNRSGRGRNAERAVTAPRRHGASPCPPAQRGC